VRCPSRVYGCAEEWAAEALADEFGCESEDGNLYVADLKARVEDGFALVLIRAEHPKMRNGDKGHR
jgi:hypothetical protein